MDYPQLSYHNQNGVNIAQHQTAAMRMHEFAFPTATYSQSTYPQMVQHTSQNVNKAAAIIDNIQTNNDHIPKYAAAIMNNIQANNFVHNTHPNPYFIQQLQQSQPIGLASATHYHNVPSLNHHIPIARKFPYEEQNMFQNRHDNHKYYEHNNKYDRDESYCGKYHQDRDRYHNKYENVKYNYDRKYEKCYKYDKYNKYDYKYNQKRNNNVYNRMSYYDDHENGRSERDRDRNDRVVAFSTTNVYINGIPRHWNYAQVEDYFSKYGTILSVNLWRDHKTGYSRGSGFVDFKNPYSAEKCIKEMRGMHFEGCKPLIIKYADIRNHKNEVKRRETPKQNDDKNNTDNRSIKYRSNFQTRQVSKTLTPKTRSDLNSGSRSRSRSRDRRYNNYYENKYEKYNEHDYNKENETPIIDYGPSLKLDENDKYNKLEKNNNNKNENDNYQTIKKDFVNKNNDNQKDFINDSSDSTKSPSIASNCSDHGISVIEDIKSKSIDNNNEDDDEYIDFNDKHLCEEKKDDDNHEDIDLDNKVFSEETKENITSE